MRKILIAFLVLFALWAPCDAHADATATDKPYLALVDAAARKTEPEKTDWPALRDLYVKTSFYSPYGAQKIWSDLIDTHNAIAGKAGVAAYTSLQTQNYAHYRTHMHGISLCMEGKKPDYIDCDRSKQSFKGIIDSIIKSGDGRSTESAFKVIDVSEEYTILRSFFGLESMGQRLHRGNGHVYDVLRFKDPKTGKTGEMYFNIDTIMARGPY